MNNKEKTFVSAVIYIRNNATTLGEFVENIGGVLEQNFENYEIIAVDDASTDNSVSVLEDAVAGLSGSATIVKMSFEQGQQAGLNAGVDIAIGDFVFEFDSAALDFAPALVREVYDLSLSGYDVVSAVPKRKAKFMSRVFYKLYNRHSGSQYPLKTEKFRLVSRRAINRVNSMTDNVTYRKAFYRNSGLACAEAEYTPNKDCVDRSVYKERTKLATDSLILFTTVAYKLALVMAIIMMALALFSGIYTVVIFLLQMPIPGWTTTMLLMSVGFFGVFAILTMVLKYMSVLVELNFKKNRYTFESVRKIT